MLKTYRLTFESTAAVHAVFDTKTAKNKWTISSKTLREFTEHFGPGTEQLDIYSDEGRVSFTSFTEKVVANNGKFTCKLWYSLLKFYRDIEAAITHIDCNRYTRIWGILGRAEIAHCHQRQRLQDNRSPCWNPQHCRVSQIF